MFQICTKLASYIAIPCTLSNIMCHATKTQNKQYTCYIAIATALLHACMGLPHHSIKDKTLKAILYTAPCTSVIFLIVANHAHIAIANI